MLEALYNLQNGICAYDSKPCLLLLPPADEFKELGLVLSSAMKERCATIDHVTPKAHGGTNNIDNYVMSSQVKNCEKGSFDPVDEWQPRVKRYSNKHIEDEIIRVEHARWREAELMAADVSCKTDAKLVVVRAELEKLYRDGNIEIYTPRPSRKMRTEQPRGRNGEKKKRKIRRGRTRSRPTRPRKRIKDHAGQQ